MDLRRAAGPLTAALLAVVLAACVPDPTNRLSPAPTTVEPTDAPTPTPAGPTPTPSFARPTPKPRPTFLSYLVRTGDTLSSIAKKHGTSGRSIAYWNRAAYPSLDPDSGTYKPDYIAIGWILALIPDSEVDPENLPTLPPTPGPSQTPSTSPRPS